MRTGFTLVELMLVLAIASLLLVMVVPSWRHVQIEAKINEAQLTLDRLVIRQFRFFSSTSDMPSPVSCRPLRCLLQGLLLSTG